MKTLASKAPQVGRRLEHRWDRITSHWSAAPESGTIARFRYQPGTETLEVQFRSGSIYQYFDVPPFIDAEFRFAESKGKFFNKRIRDRFCFNHR
jgi:hypothetical protein